MPPMLMAAPVLQAQPAEVVYTNGKMLVSIPVRNVGDETATRVTLTSARFPEHPVISVLEPTLPFVLGNLGPSNSLAFNTIFSTPFATPGGPNTLTMSGTYIANGQVVPFTLSSPVTFPAQSESTPLLMARLQASVNAGSLTWSYTVFNDEPSGSPRYVTAFTIDMARPFVVTATPPGWAALTSATSVMWYCTDTKLPYQKHIAPGASRSGFQIQSSGAAASEGRPYSIASWNHQSDQADYLVFATTSVPARP